MRKNISRSIYQEQKKQTENYSYLLSIRKLDIFIFRNYAHDIGIRLRDKYKITLFSAGEHKGLIDN